MTQISKVLTSLLEDKSFPSMVRLDGQWGVGKTYFVEHDLRPYLQKNGRTTVFFSLIGINSLNDFRDKLISSVYFSDQVDHKFAKSFADNALAILDKAGDNGGLISTFLKSSAGVAKHSLLGKISDIVVILDDLERINDEKVEGEIVGDCLQLINDNNLEFIFIMNSERSSINNALLEKAFSDRVYFKRTLEDVVDIAFEKHDYFDMRDVLIDRVEKCDFYNLRVLNRAGNRLKLIFDLIKTQEHIDVDSSMKILINQVINISYLFYSCGKSIDEINFGLDYTNNILPPDTEHSDEFKPFRTMHTPTLELIEFCCGKRHIVPDINSIGRIVSIPCPVDRFMFERPYQLDTDTFNDLLKKTTDYIFIEEKVELTKWFQACENYRYLLENDFVSGNVSEFLDKLVNLAAKKEFFAEKLNARFRNLKLSTSSILDLFNFYSEKLKVSISQHINDSLYLRVKESWSSVDNEFYRKYRSGAFINKFTAEKWIEAIDNWPIQDIGLFSNYLSDTYKPGNITGFYQDDIQAMKMLRDQLKAKISTMDAGVPKGSRVLIITALEDGLAKMSINSSQSNGFN